MDARLTAVRRLISGVGVVVDVGCDHALLAVDLARSGIGVIASDVREGPVDAARRRVSASGLEAVIDVRLGDGLQVVTSAEQAAVSDVVIAGMGGETIAAILQDALWVCDGRIQLILQPMTRAAELRRWLFSHGFALVQECCVVDGQYVYSVMRAVFSDHVEWREVDCWLGKIPQDETGAAYRRRQVNVLQKQLRGAVGAEQVRLSVIIDEIRQAMGEFTTKEDIR